MWIPSGLPVPWYLPAIPPHAPHSTLTLCRYRALPASSTTLPPSPQLVTGAVGYVHSLLSLVDDLHWAYITCDLPVPLQKVMEVCASLLEDPFKSCHEFVSPFPYMASCSNDLCL